MDRIQELKNFVNEELLSGDLTIEVDDNLLRNGMVDSIGMVRLVGFIEENYQISIPPEDFTIENFQSVKVIAEYLQTQENKGNPQSSG